MIEHAIPFYLHRHKADLVISLNLRSFEQKIDCRPCLFHVNGFLKLSSKLSNVQ